MLEMLFDISNFLFYFSAPTRRCYARRAVTERFMSSPSATRAGTSSPPLRAGENESR